jgi:hypothetical protein
MLVLGFFKGGKGGNGMDALDFGVWLASYAKQNGRLFSEFFLLLLLRIACMHARMGGWIEK